MGNKAVEIDCSQFEQFISQVEAAGNGEFKKAVQNFLKELGNKFLEIVEEQIISRNVMDTRLLLNSFHKGDSGNIWKFESGGMSLEIGTNVKYASYVNDGHWTNPKGVAKRFIPGDVKVDSNGKIIEFTYNPGAETGITLKQKWIEGKHYWEGSIRAMNKLIPKYLEKKLSEWLSEYFGL